MILAAASRCVVTWSTLWLVVASENPCFGKFLSSSFFLSFCFPAQVGAVQRKYPLLFGEVEDRAPSFASLGRALSHHLLCTVGFT